MKSQEKIEVVRQIIKKAAWSKYPGRTYPFPEICEAYENELLAKVGFLDATHPPQRTHKETEG